MSWISRIRGPGEVTMLEKLNVKLSEYSSKDGRIGCEGPILSSISPSYEE